MMMAEETLNLGLMNDFDFSDDDDDGFGIDADAFFNILNEDNSDQSPFPIGPFYPSADNTQESGSAIHVNDHLNIPSQTDYGAASENSAETVEVMDQLPHSSSPEMVLSEVNDTSFSKESTEVNAFQLSNYASTEFLPFGQDWQSMLQMSSANHPNSLAGLSHDVMSTNEAMRGNMTSDLDDSRSSLPWSDTKISIGAQAGAADVTASQVHMYDFFDGAGTELFFGGDYPVQHVDTMNTYDNSSGSTTTEETSVEPYHWRLVGKSFMKQSVEAKDEKDYTLPLHNGSEWKSSEANTDGLLGGFSFGSDAQQFLSYAETQYSGSVAGGPANYFPNASSSDNKISNLQLLEHSFSSADLFSELSSSYYNIEREDARNQHSIVKPNPWEGPLRASQRCLSEGQSDVDDNNDLCVLENMSEPARLQTFSARKKPVTLMPAAFTPQCSKTMTPFHQMGPSGTKSKASDERLIFQSLVQDLSQPKSEASPPDGVLAVPLLRHQRIALSWMVQKETSSLHCSGGILADDQGLGKTVSTIALILTEKSTSAKASKGKDSAELETLDLDEEDDKQMVNKIQSVKGRPSGGTLIVCPTSVIRQWDAELRSKVSSDVGLSVYVYHGNNRTKDSYELAKHDVVLTTYSIVSMEVPKQPVVLKIGSDGRQIEVEDPSVKSNKKRKHSSTSDNRPSKKGMDSQSIKPVALPLARVGWFRVVLDEAQSIKNFRTRVAQACWGLRAKRRWCLSGTPIQNAVDDLYSYFRFLKYDPYSVYNSFCSMVKIPISKTPSKGYPKLQAVLKNIMLRRTKGTLLDGKPIINLPPKTVTLKKVEFSEEERDFYSRLEADSRAQFQAYADSGTVKQNYVNILLMLLRLRQACDHPFLVEGGSSSIVKSSIRTAKSLPREKQIFLLSCLEGSLAICGVCRDPPEDAVVCICGHVFCNQCISLRLNGDENQCPSTNCKSELKSSHVFSKGTLNSCLLDSVNQDSSHVAFAAGSSDQSEFIDSQPPVRFESSKIKAALEVLRALSKPHVSVPDDVTVLPVASDINLLDKSDAAPCATDNEHSNVSDGLSRGNVVVKEKAIVFSQWTRMLDLLEDCLKESSIQYRRLDGTMSVSARDKAVQDFNTLPEISVMIMSLKAASLGLNMVAACHVVLLDLWWNPTTEDQAIDRAHRIGQTRPVTVVRLTVKDTVEDRILALQQKKRELVASAFGEDEKDSRQSRLTVEDLTYLFMA